MAWYSGLFGSKQVIERVAPETKSFFDNPMNNAFGAQRQDSAFDMLRGQAALFKYETCPPLAIGINKIAQAMASLDIYFYQNEVIVKNDQVYALINRFKKHRDMARYIQDVQCAGRAYVVLVGNVNYAPSKIACVRFGEVSAFEDQNRNVFKLEIPIGLYAGVYNQVEYDGDVYYSQDKLKQIILVRNQVSEFPLSPISAAINIIHAGYTHNFKTIKNGGRLGAHYQFKDQVPDSELASRRNQINKRYTEGGLTISSGGELDIKEFGLSAKDMEWSTQLKEAKEEVFNFLEIPLALISTDASTFNNLSAANAQFYENKVLPLCDYLFGRIGDVLAPLLKLKNVQMLANRENIDALQDKRIAALSIRAAIGIETTDELRSLLDNRPPVPNGDKILVSSLKAPLDTLGQPTVPLT